MNKIQNSIIISRLVVCILWLGLICAATTVQAGEQTNAEKAKAAFQKGRELFENRQFAQAAIQFKVAYKIKPTWKLLYNIGQCEAGAKRYGLALESFERYLVEGGDDVAAARGEDIRKEMDRLRDMVGFINVDGPDSAEVFIDGVKRGNLPLSGYLPVSASVEHTVSGIFEGNKLKMRKVKLMSQQVYEVTLEVIPAKSSSPPLPAVSENAASEEGHEEDDAGQDSQKSDAAAEDTSTAVTGMETEEDQQAASPLQPRPNILRIAGWSAIGLGGAGLIAGAVTGLMAMQKDKDLQNNCLEIYEENGYGCVVGPDYQKTINARDDLGTASTILFISGSAIAATGVVLLLVSKKKSETISKFGIEPFASANLTGAAVHWKF